MLYRLAGDALDDLDSLLYSIAEHSGWEMSMRTEEKLFAAFERLGSDPGIGHLREDLIPGGRSTFAIRSRISLCIGATRLR